MVLQNSEMNIKIEFEGLLWPKNETLGTRLANLEVEGPT